MSVTILSCCLGGIVSPPEGTIYTFLSGSTGNLTWIFDDEISTLVLRAWYFTRVGGSTQELLATIHDDNVPKIRPSDLSGVEIVKPATLVLRHVNQSYDGKYRFRIIGSSNQDVDIRVFIASKFFKRVNMGLLPFILLILVIRLFIEILVVRFKKFFSEINAFLVRYILFAMHNKNLCFFGTAC